MARLAERLCARAPPRDARRRQHRHNRAVRSARQPRCASCRGDWTTKRDSRAASSSIEARRSSRLASLICGAELAQTGDGAGDRGQEACADHARARRAGRGASFSLSSSAAVCGRFRGRAGRGRWRSPSGREWRRARAPRSASEAARPSAARSRRRRRGRAASGAGGTGSADFGSVPVPLPAFSRFSKAQRSRRHVGGVEHGVRRPGGET